MKEAIQKAIEGGWNEGYSVYHHGTMGDVLLVREVSLKVLIESEIREDPDFWESLGKGLGWKEFICPDFRCQHQYDLDENHHGSIVCSECGHHGARDPWVHYWHRLIGHLSEGRDAESFFINLLK